MVEGSYQPTFPVMIQFASMDQARLWYDSEEYRELKNLRLSATVSNAFFMEGLSSESPGAGVRFIPDELSPQAPVTTGCDLDHIPLGNARLDCVVVAVLGLGAPQEQVMRVMKFISMVAIVAVCSAIAVGQAAPAKGGTTVKHVSITNAPSNSGPAMYKSYCAVCHGVDGKGNGPAASAMKTAPNDLTALAKNSGGKYPAAHVAAVIRGQATTPSHGSQDMPVWGPLFSSISQGHEGQVQQRITNLVTYIESQQAK